MNKTKPKTYRLGEVLFKHLEDDAYYSEEESWYLLESELIRYGAVPVKSKQIEKSNIDFKSKTDWQAHLILLENKINEIIDHLQKG